MDDDISIRPLTPTIGAEVLGADLRTRLEDRAITTIEAALATHGVLFFRDQDLTVERQKAFGARFGELVVHPNDPGLEGHPEVMVIHADESSTRVAGEMWHSDVSCDPEPPMGSILRLHTVPEHGGDTLFVNAMFTTRLLGLPKPESDALLDFLFHHVQRPEFHCRFRWRANSIAFWDNRSTQHHAIWDYSPQTRSGYRVTIRGDRPV